MKHCTTLETLIAELERDPEMKAAMDEARAKIKREGFVLERQPLGVEFERVLYENLWDLYEGVIG